MKKQLLSIFLIIFLFFGFTNYSFSRSSDNLQCLFIIYSSEDDAGIAIFNNTINILESNDISYISFDISKRRNLPLLSYFSEIIISTEFINYLSSNSKKILIQYVKDGGKILQLIRFYDKELVELFGIKYDKEIEVNSNGVKFYLDFSPGLSKISIPAKDSPNNSSYKYIFNNNINIISKSYDDIPLLWEYQYGRGKTLFWNSTFLTEKDYRGLIISSITYLLDISARKVYGIGGIFIDDMPSPSWKIKWSPIKTEYNITDTEYYYNILIPDLIELAKKYNLKYTTAAIFAYNDKITPPFDFGEWNNTTLTINNEIFNIPEEIIKILKKNDDIFEIGFHGYNHQPFTISRWDGNIDNMNSALYAAKEKWKQIFGNTNPEVYVPPMNVVDEIGFDATVNVFNTIKSYSSLYQKTLDDGCGRDFGPEIWNDQITAIPRVSSGYEISDYDLFLIHSTLETYGIWTHFLHPDDVFSTPENFPGLNLEWMRNPDSTPWKGDNTNKNGLYYKFENSIMEITKAYPWLKFDTISNVNKKMRSDNINMDNNNILVTSSYIEFSNYTPQTYIIEIPYYLNLKKTDNFTITSDTIYRGKRRVVINVERGCMIHYINI